MQGRKIVNMSTETDEVQVICRVPRSELCYFRYTLESYEGVCLATTLPGREGRVLLSSSAGLRPALADLLEAVSRELPLEIESWSPRSETTAR